jgi:hypothetical protein
MRGLDIFSCFIDTQDKLIYTSPANRKSGSQQKKSE